LPLSQALQSGLARAGARVLSSEDNSAAIHPAHVLLSLLERAEGGLAAAVMAAGKSPRDLVHALAQALGLEPWTEDQIPPRFRSGRVPDENLRQLLEQTRREGRSRGAPVATTRDFLRSILAQDHPVRDALATVGLNLQVLRDLLDEHHYPDQEELEIEEETQEPVAQPGWPDPLAGLDPQTREELLQAMKHEQEGLTPPPQKLPAIPPRPTGNPESYRRDPRAPARDNRHPRRLILTNPEIPTVDLVDATADQLAAGRIVVFPSDCGIHALVRLGDEQAAAQLLKFRRGLDFATSEILIHNLRAAGAFPDSHNITQHQGLLDNLGDYRVAVRLLWNTRHSAIDILDETPKTGWHLGWRIPAHTALLAVLATLNQPVLALRARSIDPAMEALLAHDSQPVSLAVHPRTIPLPITPAVLDLRSRVPRIESPGDPPEEVSTIRRLLGSIPP
jgi:tRNA A37 threonylcarbamoyladenosine synthetase subunit TsaC/SUA5/YrdC